MKPVMTTLTVAFFFIACSKANKEQVPEIPEAAMLEKHRLIDSFRTTLPGNWAITYISGLTDAELNRLTTYDPAHKQFYPILKINGTDPIGTVPENPHLGNTVASAGCNTFNFNLQADHQHLRFAGGGQGVTGKNCMGALGKAEGILFHVLEHLRSYKIENGLEVFDENQKLLLKARALKPSAVN